jgi:hypothetical protein
MGFVPTGHRPIKIRHFYQAGDKEDYYPSRKYFSVLFNKNQVDNIFDHL